MPYQTRLIANPRVGLEKDLEPWLIPNDAFFQLFDCYLWRGRIKKRYGSKYIGQIARWTTVSLGTRTTDPQNFTGNFPTVPIIPGTVEIADPLFAPMTYSTLYVDDGNGNLIASISNTTPPVPIAVTGVTSGPSTVLTVASHPFANGDVLWILDVGGIVGINSVPATITANTPTSITVSISTTGSYTSGGTATWYGGTVNYTTGAINVNFYSPVPGGAQTVSAVAKFYVYNPITGIATKTSNVLNVEDLIVFDYQKAYRFNTSTSLFDDITFNVNIATQTGAFVWAGNINSSNIFWSINYANSLFVTNFSDTDPIRYLTTISAVEKWIDFTPTVNTVSNDKLLGALMLFSYRGRLVALYTTEGSSAPGQAYPQRARWSQNGTPYYAASSAPSPFGVNVDAWYDNVNGKGGFADAATNDQIVSAEFINDVLIVYFEYSSWVLRYTYDPQYPFVWERLNNDFGSECTFSTISYQNLLFTVDLYGITQSNGTKISRIDPLIPDEVFEIQSQPFEPIRVYGIRNYVRELFYWTFPSDGEAVVFPNRILVFNYIDQSWSIFRDSYTCFGNWQPSEDLTWQDVQEPWQDFAYTWSNPTGNTFSPAIIGGNQQGFVLQLDYNVSPDPSLTVGTISVNGTVVTITMPFQSDGITPTHHNLDIGQFVQFSGLVGTNVSQFNGAIFKITATPSASSFSFDFAAVVTPITYTANSGYISVQIDFDILTKRFNLSLEEGLQTRLGYTDFYVDTDEAGAFEVDIFIDEDSSRPVTSNSVSCAQEPPTPFNNSKVWKRDYENAIGQLFQYHIYQSDEQMMNPNDNLEFVLHALLLHIDKAGRLTY